MGEIPFNPEIGLPTTVATPKTPEVTPQQLKNLDTLNRIINCDDKLKKALINCAPPYNDEIGYGDGISYEEKLNGGLKKIISLFDYLGQDMSSLGLSGEDIKEKSQLIEQEVKTQVLNSKWDFNKLSSVYQKYFSRMNSDFVRATAGKVIAYYDFRRSYFSSIIKNQVQSFNELLHLAHTDVTSDENLFTLLPLLDSTKVKDTSSQIDYNLYGENNYQAQKIFSYLKEKAISITDNHDPIEIPYILQMLSTKDTIHLIVRDFGHALTIEIDISDPDSALIRYSIPKIWDGSAVNKLPGVNRVAISQNSNTDRGATGRFTSSYNDIEKTIYNFILQVPTDTNY